MAPALSRKRPDDGKWVDLLARVFALMLACVVTIAGLSAVFSTRQASGLLDESLSLQGRAIADALARAAFVPLTLEDNEALASLLEAYRGIDNVEGVAILDPQGKVLHEAARAGAKRTDVSVRSPILPLGSGKALAPDKPIGFIEARMWSEQIKAKSRKIAWVNVLASGALSLAVSGFGFFMIRGMMTRMKELVGEARLVEEVKRANAELESFSYSVSHDLRAPLRAIDGFSRILGEEYAAKLDDEGKRLFQVIRNNTQKMGQLIDDLLAFSRLGRKEVSKSFIDMKALALATLAELQSLRPDGMPRCVVKELPPAYGDPAMLRQVVANLLSNAVKFTGKTKDGAVEIGGREDAQGCEYYVKDNGAGFDMKYAHKLFGVFQRLHGQEEFQGTGVGLAIVERVVNRHGGKVWAQSEVNAGATFFFTLPKNGEIT